MNLSTLFGPDRNTLLLYSFMYGPEAEAPCPMCTSFLDGLDGSAPHIQERVALAIVAKSPIERILAFAGQRGWRRLRLLSSRENSYNRDYHAETADGAQIPALNIFTRNADGIHHFYAAEVLYAETDGHPRHIDQLWPIWNAFAMVPPPMTPMLATSRGLAPSSAATLATARSAKKA